MSRFEILLLVREDTDNGGKKLEMETLKYTIIKNAEQYKTYCDTLEKLIFEDNENSQDEAELPYALLRLRSKKRCLTVS